MSKRVITYNASDELVEINEYDAYGKRIGMQKVSFDGVGNRIDQAYTLVKGALVKTAEQVFDHRGYPVENSYFFDQKLTAKEVYRYDDLGNRVETIYYDPFKKEERITHIKYDSLHHVIETIILNSSSIIESRTITKYDDKHNLVERSAYGITGNLKQRIRHVYDYDENSHWTKDITLENKKPVSVTLRSIEYY
jgi:hypothetical protein